MTCEVRNKEISSQCAELLVRPLYGVISTLHSVGEVDDSYTPEQHLRQPEVSENHVMPTNNSKCMLFRKVYCYSIYDI